MLHLALAAVLSANAALPVAAPLAYEVTAEFSQASAGKTTFPGLPLSAGKEGTVTADDGARALSMRVLVEPAKEPNCQKLAVTFSQTDNLAKGAGQTRRFEAGLYACNGVPVRIAMRKGGTLALTVKEAPTTVTLVPAR